MDNQPMIISSKDDNDYLLISDLELVITLIQSPLTLADAIQRIEALAIYAEDMNCEDAPIMEVNLRGVALMLRVIQKENS